MASDDDKKAGIVWSVFGGFFALELQASEEAGWGEPGEYVLVLDDGAERHPATLTREQLAELRDALDRELASEPSRPDFAGLRREVAESSREFKRWLAEDTERILARIRGGGDS